jgi:hypothetical protein
MDFTFALHLFAVLLTILCIALVPFVLRRDPPPDCSLPLPPPARRSKWPSVLTRISALGMLASLFLLLAVCRMLVS